jgi:hypothetical protein
MWHFGANCGGGGKVRDSVIKDEIALAALAALDIIHLNLSVKTLAVATG